MQRLGIAIIIIGLALTIFTGINVVRQEKVVEIGDFQVTQDKKHGLDWSPWIGVAVIAVGGAITIFGKKK